MTVKTRDFAFPVVFLLLATTVIAVTGSDLALSTFFYRGGIWPVGELQPWHLLYKMDRIPAVIMASTGLIIALAGCVISRHRTWIKPGVFLVLLLALGPGVLVNCVLKDQWGRPRPFEIIQFGGKKEFLNPSQKGVAHGGRSFPSGHSSGAFYLSAPFFIYRRRKPVIAKRWLIGGLCFGVAMSIARIAQGAHFLSDTLWAWGIVHLTAVALYYLPKMDRNEKVPATT